MKDEACRRAEEYVERVHDARPMCCATVVDVSPIRIAVEWAVNERTLIEREGG